MLIAKKHYHTSHSHGIYFSKNSTILYPKYANAKSIENNSSRKIIQKNFELYWTNKNILSCVNYIPVNGIDAGLIQKTFHIDRLYKKLKCKFGSYNSNLCMCIKNGLNLDFIE